MKNRTERKIVDGLLVLSLLITLCCWAVNTHTTETHFMKHTVQAGDTVWEIASKYADRQVKPFNEFVYEIQAQNKLAGRYIQPGDVLVIPMASHTK